MTPCSRCGAEHAAEACPYLTPTEAAIRLGVTRSHVYRLVTRGPSPLRSAIWRGLRLVVRADVDALAAAPAPEVR